MLAAEVAEVLMLDAWDNGVGAGKAATGKIGGIRVLRIPSADFVVGIIWWGGRRLRSGVCSRALRRC